MVEGEEEISTGIEDHLVVSLFACDADGEYTVEFVVAVFEDCFGVVVGAVGGVVVDCFLCGGKCSVCFCEF